jgi:adenylosuccinate synthase
MGADVTLIAGLGYGDEGKGTTVDWLARRGPTRLVVRYNGGAQAAHNVVDGERHHTFAQLGSATFVGVPTLLSRHVLVNPIALFAEAGHLETIGVRDPLGMLRVEEEALVTTPFHVAANRLREMARTGRHGSCGMGIGETMEDALADPEGVLRARDLASPTRVGEKLLAVREHKLRAARALRLPPSDAARRELAVLEGPSTLLFCLDAYESFHRRVRVVGRDFLDRALRDDGSAILFEGAQGVLLDQEFGFQPHTTWTDITFGNARDLLAGFTGSVTRLGVLRAYQTRHGAGPFVTEDPRWSALSTHDHNGWGAWQGSFRSGPLDLVATRYALDVLGGVDGLVLTNLDRLACAPDPLRVAVAYEGATDRAFFDGRDRIRVKRPFDLAHQEALTRALAGVSPVYARVAREGYAEAVAEHLGVPLRATSHGPRAADKTPVDAARAIAHAAVA